MEQANKGISEGEKLPTTKDQSILLHSYEFSGPLPHPAILEKYETIHPGLADRIVKYVFSD